MKTLARKIERKTNAFMCKGIQPTWTPIKPATTQFYVGKTKSAQVVRK